MSDFNEFVIFVGVKLDSSIVKGVIENGFVFFVFIDVKISWVVFIKFLFYFMDVDVV